MEEKICCFTGHRNLDGADTQLETRLENTLLALIDEGYTTFVAGGAIGFDTLSARLVLRLREANPSIKLHLVFPCENQDKYWTPNQKKEYALLRESADSYEYLFEKYNRYCMFKRNEKMVDMSSTVVAYYNGKEKGGTAMTVRYATKKGIRVINVYGK